MDVTRSKIYYSSILFINYSNGHGFRLGLYSRQPVSLTELTDVYKSVTAPKTCIIYQEPSFKCVRSINHVDSVTFVYTSGGCDLILHCCNSNGDGSLENMASMASKVVEIVEKGNWITF
jgi:hypothetical protein